MPGPSRGGYTETYRMLGGIYEVRRSNCLQGAMTYVQTLRGLCSREKLYWPNDRRFSVKLVPTFAESGVSRGQRDGSPTAVFSILDRIRYYFFPVVPQLYSRG
jgi:hypothetical protein